MELLEGRSLTAKLEEPPGRLTTEEATRIGVEILDVLVAAHASGIIHRDIKPDNVFLLADGRVKLLDFGIARLRSMTSRGATTASGALLGTPAYMPPEQARGRLEEIDARSDVFSAGATLFAALSGRDVREATTLNELLLLAMTEPAKPLREIAPDVPEVLARVVDRALAFERNDRWPSASAMRDALLGLETGTASMQPRVAISAPGTSSTEPCVAGAPTVAAESPASLPPSSPAAPAVRPARFSPRAIALVVFAAVAVVTSGLVLRARSTGFPVPPAVSTIVDPLAAAPPPTSATTIPSVEAPIASTSTAATPSAKLGKRYPSPRPTAAPSATTTSPEPPPSTPTASPDPLNRRL